MTKMTYGFYLQSVIAFGAALLFVVGGIYGLPRPGVALPRHLVLHLAKCVRDQQEAQAGEVRVETYR